jgi:hypothetical protein
VNVFDTNREECHVATPRPSEELQMVLGTNRSWAKTGFDSHTVRTSSKVIHLRVETRVCLG